MGKDGGAAESKRENHFMKNLVAPEIPSSLIKPLFLRPMGYIYNLGKTVVG